MYRNFLEAKRYFSKWRLKDLFDAINKISTDAYPYPQQWGTWESGFFAKPYGESQSIPKLKEALTLAGGLSGDIFDNEYLAHSADKRISMTLAQRIARHFGTSAEIVDFDPFNPLATWDAEKTYQFIPILLGELESHYGANLLSIARAYFDSEYNPIENYSMTEIETPDITREKSGSSSETETPNITHTSTGSTSATETPNITRSKSGSSTDDETTHGETNTDLSTAGDSSAGVFGFNSGSTSVPLSDGSSNQRTQGSKDNNYTDGTRTLDSSESETETETGTRTNIGSESLTESETGTRSHSSSDSETETETGTRTLTRSGNIGVTTSQQMLQSELELRKFDFMEEVFKCFDRILCGSVY